MFSIEELHERELIYEYQSGFNDALLLIIGVDYHKNWHEAMNRFDFEEIKYIEPIRSNLQRMRNIMEKEI